MRTLIAFVLLTACFPITASLAQDDAVPAAADSLVSDFDALLDLLNEDSITLKAQKEQQIVLVPVKRENVTTAMLVRWAAADGVVHFIYQLPLTVPEDRVQDVETAMMRLNHGIPIPGLGMNHEKQILYFRVSVPFQPRGGLLKTETRSFFRFAITQGNKWTPVIKDVIEGVAPAEDILAYYNDQQTRLLLESNAGFPIGKITREFADSKWKLTFAKDKSVTLERDGEVVVTSKFDLGSARIRFQDISGTLAVETPGTYQWRIDKDQIHFSRVEDASSGRAGVLAGGPWKIDATAEQNDTIQP